MEERVGAWWHQAVTRAAERLQPAGHAAAAVDLQPLLRPAAALYRAAGGRPGLRLAASAEQAAGGPRGWLQRLAGSAGRCTPAVLEPEVLTLPPQLAVLPDAALNRELYLWLAVLAAHWQPAAGWVADNQAATARALAAWPALRPRHAALLRAHLAQRPDPARLHGRAAAAERALRRALVDAVPAAVQPPEVAPVWLWLQAAPALQALAAAGAATEDRSTDAAAQAADDRRRRARAAELPTQRNAFLLAFRAESLLSWSELVRVNRPTDDSDDGDARRAANDQDELALAPDGQRAAARVRFDLDLPSAAADDLPLGPGHTLPEWDWRRRQLRPDHCAVQLLVARPAEALAPDAALRRTARRLRQRLSVLQAAPRWSPPRADGEAIDLDAWVRHATQAGTGPQPASPAVYRQRCAAERSLATLLLADLSLSTDAHVDDQRRVIDVIRDALQVFGEALSGTGDAFEVLGFSSVRRQLRVHRLKGFDEPWDARARQRVGAIRPGFYTRLGAAVREGTRRLAARAERQRLLLLLTDGKPNDLDAYEGRYGLEDTREAVRAARAAGLTPFCLSIDAEASAYLPRLFGAGGFARVQQPAQLVSRLTQVHARLTR